jgi:predicted RecA/RadA family phage recombinase
MKNFVQPGDSVEFTAPGGGVTSGVGVQIGQLLVIPTVTAAAGARFNGLITGVITHAKAPSQAWAEGAVVYWDDANSRFTTSSVGSMQAGVAVVAVGAGAGETTGTVRLDGIGRAHDGT